MANHLRMAPLAAAITAAALAATPAGAVGPSNQNATAGARIVKPLTLNWVQDLDLGTIVLNTATPWTGATVGISQVGVFNCDGGSSAKVTCANPTKPAQYKITGTNNQTVRITAPNVTLTGPSGTLLLTVDSPGTVNLGNSGNSGYTFGLGGSISLDSTTPDGVYSGQFNVTVDY
jgi:hypothetical protein